MTLNPNAGRLACRTASFVSCALLAAVAAGALLLSAAPGGRAAADGQAPPKRGASPLGFVPADTLAFISIRVTDLWSHPAFKSALEQHAADLPPLQEFRWAFGVPLEEVERFTAVHLSTRGPEQELFAVTTSKPFDRQALRAAVAPDAQEIAAAGRTFYSNFHGLSLCYFDDHTVLYERSHEVWGPKAVGPKMPGTPTKTAPAWPLFTAYQKPGAPTRTGPLAPALRLASEKHTVLAAVDPAAVAAGAPPGADTPDWFRPLLKAKLATLTVDLGEEQLRADARITFSGESDARDGAAGLNHFLDLARGRYPQAAKELTGGGDDAPRLKALLREVQTALRQARARQRGREVTVAAALKLDEKRAGAAVNEALVKLREKTKPAVIPNRIKQLAVAWQTYSDVHGHTPPPALHGKDGRPLLSWRVLLLPYLQHQGLYREFRLDEPWDSEHNKKLLAKMPAAFAPPDEAFKKQETFFQAFVGQGAAFEGKAGLKWPGAFTDGTSNTILLVEAAKSVPWTKPEDVPFDEKELLPKVGGLSRAGFWAVFCDGHVQFLPRTMKEETLRALLTRNGGEPVSPEPAN